MSVVILYSLLQSEDHIPPSIALMTEWYQSCHNFESDVRMKIVQYLHRARENGHPGNPSVVQQMAQEASKSAKMYSTHTVLV